MISFKRYNEGFNRLGIAVFIAVAFVFAGYYLALDVDYVAPNEATAEGRAVLAEIEALCAERESEAMMANLCERSERAKLELTHYQTEFAAGRYSSLSTGIGYLAGLLTLLGAWRWIASGFRQSRPAPHTEEAKVRQYLEDSIRASTTDGEGPAPGLVDLVSKKDGKKDGE